MGMFDSVYIKMQGKTVEVQTKNFECLMDSAYWLDAVDNSFGGPAPGLSSFVEDFGDNYFASFILLNGAYLDYTLTQSEEEAHKASEILLNLWADVELQNKVLSAQLQIANLKKQHYQKNLMSAEGFFHDHSALQNHQKDIQDFLDGNVKPIDMLCNMGLYSNSFIDKDQKTIKTVDQQIKETNEELESQKLSTEQIESYRSFCSTFPMPLRPVYGDNIHDHHGGFSGFSDANLEVFLNVHEIKKKLLTDLNAVCIQRIMKKPASAHSFIFSRLFNNNLNTQAQLKFKKLNPITLDYQRFYSFAEYQMVSGASYNDLTSLWSDKKSKIKFVEKNIDYLTRYHALDFIKDHATDTLMLQKIVDATLGASDLHAFNVSDKLRMLLDVSKHAHQPLEILIDNQTIYGSMAVLLISEVQSMYLKEKKEVIEVLKNYLDVADVLSHNPQDNRHLIDSFKSRPDTEPLYIAFEKKQISDNFKTPALESTEVDLMTQRKKLRKI